MKEGSGEHVGPVQPPVVEARPNKGSSCSCTCPVHGQIHRWMSWVLWVHVGLIAVQLAAYVLQLEIQLPTYDVRS